MIRRRFTAGALAALLVPRARAADTARAAAELGSSGRLRAAINFGNPILATRGADGKPQGLSVDLARMAAAGLGLELELVTFDSAGQVVEAATAARVDMAFVAIDPQRGAGLDYTPPYVIIEGAYLVRADSPLQRNEQVDRAGIRVAVGRGSAYDLFLGRTLKAATLVRAPTSPLVTDTFLAEGLDVAAGVRQQLEADARRLADRAALRLLPGRFMEIDQAIAVPKGRAAAQAWLAGFVEQMKLSNFVALSLRRHGVEGATVPP
nr:transporter substrate-binding domain-containing protein [Pelomonas sp. KK5]